MKSRFITLKERGFDFETLMWLFTRLSALVMYLFALVGLVGALVMGARTQMNLADVIRWVFMPNANHVINTNVPDLAPWATLFWKLTGSLFVAFAGAHGLHGLLSVLEDYLTIPWLRKALRYLIVVLWLGMTGVGVYLLWNV